MNYVEMKIDKLKALLKSRGLRLAGKKRDLIERYIGYVSSV
jgi:hypothetical protein